MLDSIMYPHLLDLVLEHASRSSLIALRAASRRTREKADGLLARHLVLRLREDPSRLYIDPVTVNNLDGRVPLFSRWDEAEDTNLTDWPDSNDFEWWEASSDPDIALSQRARGARKCLKHTRVLDVEGEAPPSRIAELVSAIGENAILRSIRGQNGLTILDPFSEFDHDLRSALNRPFSKFIAFTNIWQLINMPEYELLAVGARKIVLNLFVEPGTHPVPFFEAGSKEPTISSHTSEVVMIFHSSVNPGPFSALDRAGHLNWKTRIELGERDGRLTDFWDCILATGLRTTFVNLAALDKAWGLSEETAIRDKVGSASDIRFLSLEEYEEETGFDFELETQEGAWCLWKSKPGTERERRKVEWYFDHPDSDSDDFDEEETDGPESTTHLNQAEDEVATVRDDEVGDPIA
ncbi:hypothetical protein CcaverHIS002_0113260 [Cutaneotrichosporon cavernicola]|uniref:Uncharacterized protein n=1 Tax=Cutaneotrichosporon cavernicola TaxID=279322 RepID=A0AA48L0S4_9TREE|nr:uncharacterized protein CcaverHIS019_0113130 [Cutaneotrichosporon cavernicola]BEI80797.1 hypothetical protein CcaverHIS002_0113260 [Cutaneotrichosporon cavernicola]BEI88595.1 hypothetical protein CcaverHIS019_0113130 [Cutaneotrichosporon cavernicola]BEI96368.1 hypothetical protein CcaverHIS631_0113170 [Cutaneotrichosporon cavernicola]BEJ04140.1 hypothetical protein CcaverHIS641_0113150 [Cutaneotrichosporon cavernicola]